MFNFDAAGGGQIAHFFSSVVSDLFFSLFPSVCPASSFFSTHSAHSAGSALSAAVCLLTAVVCCSVCCLSAVVLCLSDVLFYLSSLLCFLQIFYRETERESTRDCCVWWVWTKSTFYQKIIICIPEFSINRRPNRPHSNSQYHS